MYTSLGKIVYKFGNARPAEIYCLVLILIQLEKDYEVRKNMNEENKKQSKKSSSREWPFLKNRQLH